MKLFVLAEDLDKPVELNPSSLVVDTVDQLRQVTGFKILLSAVPPKIKKKKAKSKLLREYPAKLKKKNGSLQVTEAGLHHIFKRLGLESRTAIAWSVIESIESDEKTLSFIVNEASGQKRQFVFSSAESLLEAKNFVESMRTKEAAQKESVLRATGAHTALVKEAEVAGSSAVLPEESLECSKEDWKLILLGGRELQFQPGETVLREGDVFQRIYQVSSGKCSVLKDIDGSRQVLANLTQAATFGEISFVLGCSASASVVADSAMDVYVIEAEYLKQLFKRDAALAGRFFRYLSQVLEKRVRATEARFQSHMN